eukprot:TRINITY_DN1820_c0_g1_i1.p1 TRINITY_DN1820_c0_g1~~TRINITY_DN1820_c0_g1_i1.p1  ORF type:complete len:470 (+),score=180.02 TRINITY_DN1820_c0_g1_i1:2975-4384(+)
MKGMIFGTIILLFSLFFWKIFWIRKQRDEKKNELKRGESKESNKKLRIAFVHLDLGLGGAERLVVDAAAGMIRKGNQVFIFTTNHPKDHCFPETLNMNVIVYGNWIPHHLFGGKFQTILSSLRMAWLSLSILFNTPSNLFPHVFFLDGVSSCIPILQLSGRKVLFYCHHPDLLLTRKKSFIRSVYRYPIDLLEELTTGMADKIVVNSKYTSSIFQNTFKRLSKRNIVPDVVYPVINVSILSQHLEKKNELPLSSDKKIILSVNRFDPAKKVETAVEGFVKMSKKMPQEEWKKVQLIVAGGYDERVSANREYLDLLSKLAEKGNLKYSVIKRDQIFHSESTSLWKESSIIFMPDVSDSHKMELLKRSACLVYTPSLEHFGIVPVEAMFAECPVVAVNNGGLLETITLNKQQGLLCPPGDSDAFATAMQTLVENPELGRTMGKNGKERASKHFSLEMLENTLNSMLQEMAK